MPVVPPGLRGSSERQVVMRTSAIRVAAGEKHHKEARAMPTGSGRDGPAREARCREDRIEPPLPAPDRAPTTSKLVFLYGTESGGHPQSVEPVEQCSGVGLTAYRRSCKTKGTFRGAVRIEFRSSEARRIFLLTLLFGEGPPPGAGTGVCVRSPRLSPLPAGGAAVNLEQQAEEVVLVGVSGPAVEDAGQGLASSLFSLSFPTE